MRKEFFGTIDDELTSLSLVSEYLVGADMLLATQNGSFNGQKLYYDELYSNLNKKVGRL